jgi:ArsR family transcriptional regulator
MDVILYNQGTLSMHELVKISKALADETRVRMLKLLWEQGLCICEIREVFPLSQSQVSRSLRALMDAGFLKRWREGKHVCYLVDRNTSNRYCQGILDAFADSLNDDPVVIRAKQKLQDVIARQVRERKK